MTRLVVKLLLSVIALPLGFGVFVFSMFSLYVLFVGPSGPPRPIENLVMMLPFGLAPLSVVGLWTLIWRRHIRWTGWRKAATWAVALGCVALAVGGAVLVDVYDEWVPLTLIFYALSVPSLLALIWRSSRREQRDRLDAWLAAPTLQCPYCQANLAGRLGVVCPYCGGDLASRRPSDGANA